MSAFAIKGNVKAFSILMAYAYGRPLVRTEINASDISPQELLEYVMQEYHLTREQALPIVAKYFPQVMDGEGEMQVRDETAGFES